MTSTEASGAAREFASLGREALALLERRRFTLRPGEPSAWLAYDSSRVQLRLRRDPRGYVRPAKPGFLSLGLARGSS